MMRNKMKKRRTKFALNLLSAVAIAALVPHAAKAEGFGFSTDEIGQYLLIGLGPVNDGQDETGTNVPGIGQAVNVNNYELGANKAPTPSPFGTANGSSLLGNVPDIPEGSATYSGTSVSTGTGVIGTSNLNAQEVGTGIGGDGNIAITHSDGVLNLQDVGVYADPSVGIRCTASVANCNETATSSNSAFYDGDVVSAALADNFPNTFTRTGITPGTNNTEGTGQDVPTSGPNSPPASTLIAPPGNGGTNAGVTGNFNFTPLLDELFGAAGAWATISGYNSGNLMEPDGRFLTLNVSGSGTGNVAGGGAGIINSNLEINLESGLNIIDFDTGGGVDLLLSNTTLVIDGPEDAFAIFRLPDDANFNITNSNILAGDRLGLNNIVFYTDKMDSNQHFNFSNTILNGISFWSLGRSGGEINIDNAQGCVQLVADKITLNDVRFDYCGPGVGTPPEMPEPTSLTMTATGLIGLFKLYRRKKRASQTA